MTQKEKYQKRLRDIEGYRRILKEQYTALELERIEIEKKLKSVY